MSVGASVIQTSGLCGIDSFPVRAVAHLSEGSEIVISGAISEASVREMRVRLRSALALLGVPSSVAWTVAIESAQVSSSSSAYDLAAAVAVLAIVQSSGGTFSSRAADTLFLGELSLAGEVRPIRGVLPRLRAAVRAGFKRAVVPQENATEAALVEGIEVLAAQTLGEVRDWLAGGTPLLRALPREPSQVLTGAWRQAADVDMEDIVGQPAGRFALEVAAAGGHHLMLSGPPGSGKTMLARRLPGILPIWTREEALAATEIHSVAGLIGGGQGLLGNRPFRAPHHTVSDAGLLGGGSGVRPGEVSLAHEGVLLLDEIVEMKRSALEALILPLRNGVIRIASPTRVTEIPARALVVGAMNGCPCGNLGNVGRVCTCGAERIAAYEDRVRGILGCFDLFALIPSIRVSSTAFEERGESSATIRERVTRARAMQAARFAEGNVSVPVNSRLFSGDLDRADGLSALGLRKVLASIPEGITSKVLRVARTVADLDGVEEVTAAHVEAAYRLRGMP